MSRMKHLLRKLHIGGGGGGGGGAGLDHQHRLGGDPRTAPSSSSSSACLISAPASSSSSSPSPVSAPPSSSSSSSRRSVQEAAEPRGIGPRCDGPPAAAAAGGDFSLFEEEYQVQLALAISASDPDGLEDPDSVQIKAAKRMSLGCLVVPGGGGSRAGDESPMEFLSRRYCTYNVVNYDEKLTDGFYDAYGVISNPNLRDKMPALVDLQATSITDNIDYEVVLVNRSVDPELQQLERRAVSIALESKYEEHDPIASGLIQKIADLVVDRMGGPVGDAEGLLRRWTIKSYELRTSSNASVLLLGSVEVGLSRHRALLFKVLADKINLACKLVKGSYYTGSDEGAVNLIKIDHDREYIVDLMGAPGTLIPVENPSVYLQTSGNFLLSSDAIEQTCKDLRLALDKVSCQFEKKNNMSEATSYDNNSVSGHVGLQPEEKSRVGSSSEDVCVNVPQHNQSEISKNEFGKLRSQADALGTREVVSPAQQMKVNDLSKYVVTAARNPEFAQKLHAVLLESGASPPPDLFSDLNSSQDHVEQKDLGKSICMARTEGAKEDQLPEVNLISHFQPSLAHYLEAESSRHSDDKRRQHCFVDEITHKQGKNSNIVANPISSGASSPCAAANEWLLVNDTQANVSTIDDSWAKCTGPVPDTAVVPVVSCQKQINLSSAPYEADSSQTKCASNLKLAAGKQCSQEDAGRIIHNTDTQWNIPSKGCQESLAMVKLFGMDNTDQHILSGPESERIKPILDGVAEWEIPWEDLQIGERIGLGSYGEVYRADWNGTEVAVKKFLDQGLSGDALEQFRCEVKIMSRLRHPNVVLFMGAVTRPPNLSIMTEFLPRGSLYRLLHRLNVQLDEKRRLKMALDVAKGMNYLHTSHPTIVHRDLKSPNLLVDKNWVVKVCDFGLSRLKHHTFLSSKSTAGTPEWMAPEVLRNEPSNEKCDVYSFGVILWELATLRMPWSGMNPMQVVGAVGFQNRRLDIPKEVDPVVAQIITDCWESEPSKRPSFAQLMSPLKQLQRLVVTVN
ncbi:probable serine/threonine-protein kinase SIS8 isoform X2 [Phoenix dactylifera]|uniref:non-specific serine/threonine protein kinase n=1 Tax=Phoenix dactylifera TaxID=42345 RepID=A0A8B7C786_PHODC|nr:probable serine/threonine-protein kinase SIS8 isoform X2 [Phoenix dactylifera]